jgi:hypothetical protein
VKADTVDLAGIFGNQVRYMVPLYQRPYVWNRDDQWEPLWQDVQAVADRQLDGSTSNDEIPHFLGAVVLEQPRVQTGRVQTRTVIDGQQRLTTLQLLLAAARSVAEEHGLEEARQTFEQFLLNEPFLTRHDGYQYKVLPTQRDRAAFRESMQDGVAAATGAHRMHEAFRYFRSAIGTWLTDLADDTTVREGMDALTTVLWSLVVVVTIDLDASDNPQVIFETLNARGTPLLAGDLIKNHLFQVAMTQGANLEVLYDEQWRHLDTEWWREEVRRGRFTQPRLDSFLSHWLVMRTGGEVISHDLFPAFKRYLADGSKLAADVVSDLERYARVYESFEKEPPGTELGRFLYRLGVMEVTTAYPVLLWLLGPEGIDEPGERSVALGAIESWLVRRLITRMTTKNYNVVFLALLNRLRSIARERAVCGDDVSAYLAGLSGESQVWPSDEAVLAAMRSQPLYGTLVRSRLRMVLEALELASYTELTERVDLQQHLTIEHVLPQEWAAHWPLPPDADPVEARTRRDTLKHTIGNLTLITGKLNPRLSNGPWLEKRDALRKHSLLLISADIRDSDTWDEGRITARSERLARTALDLWSRPPVTAQDTGQGTDGAPHDVAETQGDQSQPVPVQLPDEDHFSAVLATADAAGVGLELRRIVHETRELGLDARPYRGSVLIVPPERPKDFLMTLWPQARDGGMFRVWTSASAFARHVPGVHLEEARAELGSTEGAVELRRGDVDRLLASLRRLVSSARQRGGPREEPPEPAPDVELRHEIDWLIETRAGPAIAPLARDFAREALRMDGVVLRPQGGKGEPSYFQVRHPRFRQVVAYVNPRPTEVHIDYRLPSDHETYGVAVAADYFYGISFKMREAEDLDIALRLLRDALARPE